VLTCSHGHNWYIHYYVKEWGYLWVWNKLSYTWGCHSGADCLLCSWQHPFQHSWNGIYWGCLWWVILQGYLDALSPANVATVDVVSISLIKRESTYYGLYTTWEFDCNIIRAMRFIWQFPGFLCKFGPETIVRPRILNH
jgi:hypothetical protein